MDAARVPVIVGVGQINDRPDDPALGLDSMALMQAALVRADADAGGGWLTQLNWLSVVDQISCPELGDVSAPLADALGAHPAHCAKTPYPSGDSPIRLLDEAANAIAAGDIEAAAIVGGEALRTAAQRKSASANVVRAAAAQGARPLRQRYGIVAPTDIYPLYENACRAAWGQTLAEAQQETAAIWSQFSRVAAQSPGAWLRTPRTAAEILAPTPDNRPIAFPYAKFMVANASVNQGAGFIVASLAKARAMGVPESALVYVGRGAAARELGDVLARDRYDRSTSLEATLRNALARNGLSAEQLGAVELYSCFPCIPKLARRAFGWPLEKPASVFGGLTFGGGPVGNYMSHAVAAMVDTLRAGGAHGLLFANGGFVTTNHAIIVSRDPALARTAPHESSVQAEAERERGPSPALIEEYAGASKLETYTVFYKRDGAPDFGVAIARTPAEERLLARIDAADTVSLLTCGAAEPIGINGQVSRGEDGLLRWRVEGA